MKRAILILLGLSALLGAENIVSDSYEKAKGVVTQKSLTKPKLTISEATLKAINDVRSKPQICSQPVSPLRWNPVLYRYAKEHSIDMALNHMLSHVGSGKESDKTAKRLGLKRGSFFYERVNQKANNKDLYSGELIIRTDTASLKSPKELINYWVQRPKDCKVIMDSKFSDVALAKVVSNVDKKAYWTLLLAGNGIVTKKKK